LREREVRGVLQEFARTETQREMGRDVLRGFVGVASKEERCGSEVKYMERTWSGKQGSKGGKRISEFLAIM
jgi:hypothetical protein